MKTIKIYSAKELKKKNPRGYDKAFEDFKNRQYNYGLDHADEIVDSLKKLFEAAGVRLKDYEIDNNYPSYSYARFEFDNDGAEKLSGQRALAWLENNLYAGLRERRTFIQRVKKYTQWFDFTKHNQIPDCPLTGVCYDDDFLDSLRNSIKEGYDLKAAFNRLAIKAGEIEEAEWEYQLSEENFLEMDDEEYTIDGRRV